MSSDWMLEASCGSLPLAEANRIFFPTDTEDPEVWTEARTYCESCPVKKQCLTAAEAHKPTTGLYAGLTPEERLELGITPVGRNSVGRKHGTYSKWSGGCRCPECVQAKRIYGREQMRKWKLGNTSDASASLIRLPAYDKDSL